MNRILESPTFLINNEREKMRAFTNRYNGLIFALAGKEHLICIFRFDYNNFAWNVPHTTKTFPCSIFRLLDKICIQYYFTSDTSAIVVEPKKKEKKQIVGFQRLWKYWSSKCELRPSTVLIICAWNTYNLIINMKNKMKNYANGNQYRQ